METPSVSPEERGGSGGEVGVVNKDTTQILLRSITSNDLIMECPGVSTYKEGAGVVNEDTKQFLLRSITSNGLISDKILSYLSFGDMKAVSLVSRDFFKMVRTSRQFNSTAVLLVTEDNAQELRTIYETPSELPLRGIRLDVAVPIQVLHDINFILEQVNFLSFITLPRKDKLPRGSLSKFILHVLTSTSKLTYLEIDVRLMQRQLYKVFTSPAVQSNLSNLKSLQILFHQENKNKFKSKGSLNNVHTFQGNTDKSAPWLHDNDDIGDSSDEDDIIVLDSDSSEEIFSKNILLLASPEFFKSLETLHVTKMKSKLISKSILLLLRNNQGTLRDLSLHLNAWSSTKLKTMIFPRLKRLTASIDYDDQWILKAFLFNHLTSLDELDIAVVRGKFDRNLFQVISSSCASLQKLHLKAKDFNRGGNLPNLDWSFLGGMKRLEDFDIARPFSNPDREIYEHLIGTGPRFLESLPRHQLQTLRFKGIKKRSSFWRTKLGNVYVEPDLSFKLDLLSGFRNVKVLSFDRCGNAVDDQVIQFIFKEMSALEEFEISHCSSLTDAGIAGTIPGQNDLVSIQNLKGLKFLSIRSCHEVTPEGLLSTLRLPSLQRFDYFTKDPVRNSFVVQFASQNLNLEVLALKLSSGDFKNDNLLCTKEFLRGISHPRLSVLINLANRKNVNENSKLRVHVPQPLPRCLIDPDSDSDADDPMFDNRFLRYVPLLGRRLPLGDN